MCKAQCKMLFAKIWENGSFWLPTNVHRRRQNCDVMVCLFNMFPAFSLQHKYRNPSTVLTSVFING